MPIDWRPFANWCERTIRSCSPATCGPIATRSAASWRWRSRCGRSASRCGSSTATPCRRTSRSSIRNNDVTVLGRDVPAADVRRDVLIVLDTSAWGQLGPMADVVRDTAAKKVVIDHHVSQDDLGAVVVQRHDVRSDRPARARGDRRAGRHRHARDGDAAVRRDRHRHRLVPLRLGDRRHLRRRGPAGPRRREAVRDLRGALRAEQARPVAAARSHL